MSNRAVFAKRAASKWVCACFVLIVCVGYVATDVSADTAQSTNYRFEESVLGTGGLIDSNSANYRVTESIGDTGIGDSASTNYQSSSGSKTTNDPALAFSVNSASAAFSPFSPSLTSTATATFSVSNYTSWGYAVQIAGSPPTHSSGYSLPAMTATGPSSAGNEQFGMNLVANTSPASFGANPAYGYFAFGDAAPNYNTSGNFRYVSGETIATAPKSSGVTQYTISYIINVSSLTPGGTYTSSQTIICTGTY